MGALLLFLVVLLVVAFFTRVDYFFYLLYALSGVYILGRFWARRSMAAVQVERHHERRVFYGETCPVRVEVRNRSRLPVLWLRLHDTVPANLAGTAFRQVISLRPRERLRLGYTLVGRRRGYYSLGPLVSRGGDLLGSTSYEYQYASDDALIVYPRIVSLRELGFPSQSPFGVLPSRERLFEDPSRIRGVRDYQAGDSLRRMDWKTSARVGSLQVRCLEPTIALETAIFLNLDAEDYPQPQRYPATEFGIVVAASVAVHLGERRQAVGLASNGRDPLAETPGGTTGDAPPPGGTPSDGMPLDSTSSIGVPLVNALPSLPVRKGREHLMHLLDLLARMEVARQGGAVPFLNLLSRKSLGLPWGSTVVVVTSREVEGLMDALLALRRRGLLVILVLTCQDREFATTARRAGQIGVQTHRAWIDRDLDVWR